MSHAASSAEGWAWVMDWRAAGSTAVRWFLVAAGGQLLLEVGPQHTVFDLDLTDWKIVLQAGVIAGVGFCVDALRPAERQFGLTRAADPAPPTETTEGSEQLP